MAERAPRFAAERAWGWAGAAATALVLAFLVLPVLAILPLSVNDSQFLTYPMRGLTGRWYEELLTESRWTVALRNTLVIGALTAALATILGTMAAVGLALADFRGKAALTAALLSPLVVPVVVFGVGLALFFGRIGLTRT